MPTICICLADNPLLSVYSFKPGEKINIQVNFQLGNIPERYRLQILDHKRNTRLVSYGRGLNDIFVYNWPIPTAIRDDHLGIWQVRVDHLSKDKNKDLEPKSAKQTIASQIFFVEKVERVEYPLLEEGEEILQIPTEVVAPEVEIPAVSEISVDITPPTEEVPLVSEDEAISIGQTPVTTIRGIGKTYAERLSKIKVHTVSQFWYYKDQIYLAETMRVSDTRLEKMLQEAEIFLSEEADQVSRIEIEKLDEFVPDDLITVYGINRKSIKKLASIGITSKTDLLDYEDLTTLRKTLKVSSGEMRKILASVGRIIEPEKVRKPVTLKPHEEFVIKIKGIGAVTARKLNSLGIATVHDLLESNYTNVQKITTRKTYVKWIQNAAEFTGTSVPIEPSEEVMEEKSNELLEIKGVGQKTVEKLASLQLFTKKDLLVFSDQEHLRKILRMSSTRFDSFVKSLAESNDQD